MKIKYIGIEPICNVYGSWKNGDVKEVPDGTKLIGFEFVSGNTTLLIKSIDRSAANIKPKKTHKRKVRREELKDKMEKDSAVIEADD